MTENLIGRSLRLLRNGRGWSQEQLADVADVSVRTIQRLERNAPASPETLKALAAAFDLEVEDLLESAILRRFQQALEARTVHADPLLGHVACPDCYAPSADFAHKSFGDDASTLVVVSCPTCGWSEEVVV
jgi:transcriptional regulator with XRE-family HTH domain